MTIRDPWIRICSLNCSPSLVHQTEELFNIFFQSIDGKGQELPLASSIAMHAIGSGLPLAPLVSIGSHRGVRLWLANRLSPAKCSLVARSADNRERNLNTGSLVMATASDSISLFC